MSATGMPIVAVETRIIAAVDTDTRPVGLILRFGLAKIDSSVQSQTVHRHGSKNPRKNISSKNGANVAPNPNNSHAAPGVRKTFSMGVLVGPGMRTPLS